MTPTRSDYEAAARAAGLSDPDRVTLINGDWCKYAPKPGVMGPYVRWDPRNNDADSRRLQVAAKIDLRFSTDRTSVCAIHDFPFGPSASAECSTDPCAAAREAVWRVAVAVGKEMAK